jgi:hypothetical protein
MDSPLCWSTSLGDPFRSGLTVKRRSYPSLSRSDAAYTVGGKPDPAPVAGERQGAPTQLRRTSGNDAGCRLNAWTPVRNERTRRYLNRWADRLTAISRLGAGDCDDTARRRPLGSGPKSGLVSIGSGMLLYRCIAGSYLLIIQPHEEHVRKRALQSCSSDGLSPPRCHAIARSRPGAATNPSRSGV